VKRGGGNGTRGGGGQQRTHFGSLRYGRVGRLGWWKPKSELNLPGGADKGPGGGKLHFSGGKRAWLKRGGATAQNAYRRKIEIQQGALRPWVKKVKKRTGFLLRLGKRHPKK